MVADRAGAAAGPGPFGRWLTELFNDWPEGSRAAAEAAATAGTARRVRAAAAERRRPRGLTAATLAYCRPIPAPGDDVATTGLSADPKEYRKRLAEQSDDQIDAWAAELMRDVAIRRGVVKVVADFRTRGPASTRQISNGCSLPAAGRRRSSGGIARGA